MPPETSMIYLIPCNITSVIIMAITIALVWSFADWLDKKDKS